jgi:hypothetical protein
MWCRGSENVRTFDCPMVIIGVTVLVEVGDYKDNPWSVVVGVSTSGSWRCVLALALGQITILTEARCLHESCTPVELQLFCLMALSTGWNHS